MSSSWWVPSHSYPYLSLARYFQIPYWVVLGYSDGEGQACQWIAENMSTERVAFFVREWDKVRRRCKERGWK